MNKRTDKLMSELKNENNLQEFTENNKETFMDKPLTDYLEILLEKYNVKRADVIKKSALATVYGYQIFDGRREPKRDKVIQLAFGFGLTLDETQRLLKCAGHSELYPKIKRDVLFIYAINNKMDKDEVEQLLFQMGEKGLEDI